ncbi:MAG: hypothetical protein Kow0029_23850 [Candidatus Rifleibacteriota bacterium]
MKLILLRFLTFVLCAMVLGFISQAGFNVEPGKVFLVGRCQVQFEGLTPELISAKNEKITISENTIGIAQVELQSYDGRKPVFKVKKIFSVKTDENGYFMVKNLSDQYTYVLLGIQYQKNIPVPVHLVTLANAREKQGKILNLGFHQVFFREDEKTGQKISEARIDTSMKNQDFMNYFLFRSPLRAFVSKIKSNDFWGKNNAVTVVDFQKVIFSDLENASWQSVETSNS